MTVAENVELADWLSETRTAREKALCEWLGSIAILTEALPERGTRERGFAYAQLVAETGTFLSSLGFEDEGSIFSTLAESLGDLSMGRASDLTQKKRPGRPPAPWKFLRPRAAAALAIDLLMECGLSVEAAACDVARRHKWLNSIRESRKNDPAKLSNAIVDWREEFDGTSGTDIAVRVVLSRKDKLTNLLRSMPEAQREREARTLGDFYLVACKPR